MEMLLKVLVVWLSINFGLPGAGDYPLVEFASAEEMVELRLSAVQPADESVAASQVAPLGNGLQAIYDDRSHTIYLLEGWAGTPAEISVLAHELVHHLQNAAALKYDCAEAREKLAYQAQQKWLQFFGTDLATEFEMDAMTLLVRTNCIY